MSSHQVNARAFFASIFRKASALLLLTIGLSWSMQAAAQTSLECPTPLTATVAWGGSVAVDVSNCDGPFDGGMSGPIAPFAAHGSVLIGTNSGNVQFVTYSHNSSTPAGGGSDTIWLEDNDLGTVRINITISPPSSAITVSPGTLPTMTAGTPFSQTLTSSGGLAPYTYSLQSGPLPAGLSLTSGGVLSGTPTQRGGYAFTVRSTDSTTPTAQFTDKGYTGTVQNPTLTLSTTSGTAIQGSPFSQSLSTTGGVAPHTYLLESGSFPAGISISSTGVVSGTTTSATGNYPVTLRVTDSSTGPGSYFELESYTLAVSAAPSVSIAVAPASVSEDGATNLVFTVTRSLNLTSPTVVNITTSGTATSGTDYTGGVATVSIPSGATTATITIDPTADGTVEANETAILTVAAGTGYTVGAPSSVTGNILNDDVPTASISVSPASVFEDGATNLVYTVTLNQASLSATSVNFTVGGTATNGTDYASIASPLVIPAGNTTGTITVDPTGDITTEADETAVITLAAGAGYVVGVPNNATGTIQNDDVPTLVVNNVSASEGNAGTINFTFTVLLSQNAGPGGVTFDIATADGTAIAGSDYVARSLTSQTIPAGNISLTFTVTVNGDTLNEANETFFVNVTNVTGAMISDGQGQGTIGNDDPAPSLSIVSRNIVERNALTQSEALQVTLSAPSGQTVTANWATANGTATAGSDYVAASGTVTFAPGQTTQSISVGVTGDTAPEADETFTVTLSAPVNATIATGTGTYTIVNDDVPVTVSPTTLPNGTVATAYSQTVTASGGTSPYTFAITAGALPAGLTLSTGGALAGTPTAGGSFNFTITATDSSPFPGPFSGSQAYTLVVNAPTISLPATSLAGGTLGTAYTASITGASSGTAPYSYAVTAGSLPNGLTLNTSTGAITGTPTALGTFNFSVTAVDSSTGSGPYTATQSYAITVIDNPPVANNSSLTIGYNAPATNVPLSLGGGAATSLTLTSPPLHGTVTVSGTTIIYQPSAGYAGPDTFTYTATNSGGTSAPATVSITVNDPTITITPSGSFSATVASPYSQTFTFAGGATPWSGYQVTNLPAGLSITATTASSVTISGTPTQAGSFNLNVSATDSSSGNGPYTVGQAFTLTVSAPTLALAPASGTLPATYGAPYSQAFTASGGTGPYTYAATGTLPPGLSFSGNTLSGTPTSPGTFNFTITATDTGSTGAGAPFTVAQNYTITIAAPVITVAPASLPNPTAGTAYSQTLTASGGVGPYAFTVSTGVLPTGLTLSTGGVLSGTTTVVGTFNFTATATDANGQTGSRAYTITVAAPILTMTPAAGTLTAAYGAPYSQSFTAAGGSGSYSYAVTGALPAGMTFSGNTLSGTPTVPGSYPITVTATDTVFTGAGAPFSIAQNYTINVPAPTITVAPATLPNTTAGLAYSQSLTATGGVGPYAFAVSTGALPNGLSLTSAGALSGTTTASGTFNFTVTATDSFGQSGSQAYSVVVAVPTLTVTPATLPNGTAGTAYTQALTVSGGIAPYTATLTGTLPTGISFNAATRTFSGTPTQSGTFNISVTITDSTGGTAATVTNNYTLTIAVPTLTMTPAAGALPAGTGGVAYSQAFTASGGIAPYSYAVASGALPAGLSLNASTGVLSGTPTVAGSFAFSIRATDSTTGTAATVTNAYTLAISAPTITINPPTLPNGIVAVPYTHVLTAIGGTSPYAFAISAGALPTGVTLSASGTLSGTPSVTGTFNFTVRATDALGFTGTRAYSIAVNERPDPSQDPDVRGLVQAQIATTRRMADAQANNFRNRMESLHDGGATRGFSNQLSVAMREPCMPDLQQSSGLRCTERPSDAMGGTAGAAASGDAGSQGKFGAWAGGSLRSGSLDSQGATAGIDFETDGISVGVDRRFSSNFAAGIGIGYGRDESRVGNDGAKLDARANTFALYASYHPEGRVFADALLGYQSLDYRMQRTSISGADLRGQRDGDQMFTSLTVGAELEASKAWTWTPYGRLDLMRATLDAYSESGDPIYALQYEDMDVDSRTGTLGLKLQGAFATERGLLQPQFRLEYQHDFQADAFALIRYADGLGPVYRADFVGFDRNRFVIGLGLMFRTQSGWGTRIEYRGLTGSDGRDNGLNFSVEKDF